MLVGSRGFACGLAVAAASVPRRPTQEKTSKAGQQHRQQRSPHKKRSGKLSGPSLRALPSLVAWFFPAGRTAASAAGASVGWRRLAPRKAEASKQSGNGGNWSIETLLRFLLFGEAGVDALAQTRRVYFVTLITRRKQ